MSSRMIKLSTGGRLKDDKMMKRSRKRIRIPTASDYPVFPGSFISGTSQQAMRTGGWANPSRGGELKFVDIAATPTITFASGTFSAGTLLNGSVPGSGATDRIGRKVVIKSLLYRYAFSLAASSTGGGTLRILIVYDKQANAAAPLITDILLADSFTSPNNLSNRDRFITLFDELTEPLGSGANYQVANVGYKKLNLEQMFNAGTAGTIGDITSGSIYLFVAQSGAIGTANPTFSIRTRVRYSDV